MILDTLLNHEVFTNYKVIAGNEGLSRKVESVNIMDAPDILNFLKPGELLLTNGYFMKDRIDLFIDLIETMNRMGCPGLAVKTKRFALAIPETIISTANGLQFPLIEISEVQHSLGEVLQQSTSLILDNKNYELQYSLSIHKQFSDMVMNGGGVPQIIETLAQLLTAPVMFISHKTQIFSFHFEATLSHFKEPLISVVQALPALTSAFSLCLTQPELSDYRHVDLYPTTTFRHEGYIVLLQQPTSRSNLYTLALEQASNVIGMEIFRQQAVKERSRRYKNEFFSDLIDGIITSEHEAISRGRKYGLKPQSPFLLVAIKKDNQMFKNNAAAFEEKHISERDVYYDLIKRRFSELDSYITLFTRNDLFGLLLSLENSDWEMDLVAEQLKVITHKLHSQEKFSVSLGIGNPVTNILDIGLSFDEAAKALQTGYQMNKTGFIQFYKSNDISYLLRLLPYDEMEIFYEETFHSFASMSDGERKELLRTLKTFLDNQCQLLETAKQLFIHRNTVIYRLEKCEKLTGVNLKDHAESLRFRVAFAIEPFLKENKDSSRSKRNSKP
ncbi:PucR family transcriptional regulator [Paenibacillus sp. 2TAB19]|uniref:PucR family transcriptional regulator n=1 Tax=Paenibacillus sp. 2TAB19 TaxID=3233003 RepID=UPI003F9B1B2C